MDRIRHDEKGGVIVTVAIVLPLLVMLSAAGITTFSLYAAHRELQTAADQAALAGAAALPPLYPNDLVEATYPLPGVEEVYSNWPDQIPRIGDLVVDPRSVACKVGSSALSPESAALVSALSGGDLLDGSEGPTDTVCDDERVHPVLQPNPYATTPVDCANQLVAHVGADNLLPPTPSLPLLGGVTEPVSDIQAAIDSVVRMDLNHLLPAAFTPRMRVDVYSWMQPPLLPLITDTGGGTMHVTATAYRRVKNAVVVPIVPSQRLLIQTGLADPVEVMTRPVNLNRALATSQRKLIEAVDDADARLDSLMARYGLPCSGLLHNLRQDLRDVYDPPTGPAPSAADIVDAAVTAATNVSHRTGIPTPDPSNPDSLAGEAFLLVGVTVDEFMNPVAATQIPILDAALVVMDRTAAGDYSAAVVSAVNAHGAFRATLVE